MWGLIRQIDAKLAAVERTRNQVRQILHGVYFGSKQWEHLVKWFGISCLYD